MTLTFTYANSNTPIAGVKVVMTESDGTVIVLVTNSSGQITLPSTSNTYTLSASLAEAGEDPISLIDAIQILQYAGELRTLTDDQKTAADVNNDGEVDVLDAIWILQHQGELRTLDSSLIFLDANTGQPLSQTTFSSNDTPSITVVRKGDVDGDFDPSLITDHAPIITGKTTLVMDENETSVSTLVGSDADGDALTYSIIGGADQSLFSINSATGVLTFKASPDYEDPTDSNANNLYDIEISVSDGTNTTTQALTIAVTNVNENSGPTAIGLSATGIDENNTGAVVGIITVSDPDSSDTHTYKLTGDDKNSFEVVNGKLKLKDSVTADYESKSSYTLTVTATDSGGESISREFTISVVDKSENVTGQVLDGYVAGATVFQDLNNNGVLDDGIDSLFGAAGNDTLTGESGNDILDGGTGTDTLTGGTGTDTFIIRAGDGSTTLADANVVTDFSNGTDIIGMDGLAFSDLTIVQGDGIDSLFGAAGNDTLTGESGNDILDGGTGTDTLTGGTGTDTFIIRAGDGSTTLADANVVTDFIDGTDVIGIASDRLFGAAGNDTLTGESGNDILDGGTGTDTLTGGTGTDTFIIRAGDGSTTLADANVVTDFSNGTDIIGMDGLAFSDLTIEQKFQDYNNNGVLDDGIDSLFGAAGNDTLTGESGNDILDGGTGTDTLTGGTGTDTFIIRAGDGSTTLADANVVTDFSNGTDIIGMDGLAFSDLTIEQGTGDYATHTLIKITTTGEYLLIIQNTTASDITEDNLAVASTGAPTVTGTASDDSLSGTQADYTTHTLIKISATGEHLLILENTATTDITEADFAVASTGAPTVTGTAGNDALKSTTYNDLTIEQGTGNYVNHTLIKITATGEYLLIIQNTPASDITGTDFAIANIGAPTLAGTANDDTLIGTQGGNGIDSLFGAAGNDTLTGESGNDILDGGTGTDTLTGGTGTDTFIIRAGDGSTTLADANVVTDFSNGTDIIGMDGLAFSDLTIEQGTGDYATHTLIKITTTGEYLLIIQNTTASDITEDNLAVASTGAPTVTGTSGDDTLEGTKQYTLDTLIKITATGEHLLILENTATTDITEADFAVASTGAPTITGTTGDDIVLGNDIEPYTTTDALGNFTLTLSSISNTAPVRIITGFDLATNEIHPSIMEISSTETGSYIVTPISTLIGKLKAEDASLTTAAAEQLVATSMGLTLSNAPEDSLLGYDPLALMNSSDATEATEAKPVYAANQLLMSLAGGSYRAVTYTVNDVLNTLTSTLQTIVNNNGGGTITLSVSDTITLGQKGYDALFNTYVDAIQTGVTPLSADFLTLLFQNQQSAMQSIIKDLLDASSITLNGTSYTYTELLTTFNSVTSTTDYIDSLTVAYASAIKTTLDVVFDYIVTYAGDNDTGEAAAIGTALTQLNSGIKGLDLTQIFGTYINNDGTFPSGQSNASLITALNSKIAALVTLAADTLGDVLGVDTQTYFSGASVILLTSGNDTADGTEGSNLIATLGGTDTVNGLGGNDKIIGGSGIDTLDGGSGNDHLYGFVGNDILTGGAGDDKLVGGLGDDTLSGGAGDDELQGQTGNDTFNTGAGSDSSYGGLGNDTFNVTDKSGAFTDIVDGSSGTDTLVINYTGISNLGSFSSISYDSSTGYFTLGTDANGGTVKFKNIENLTIGDYTYTEDASADTFWNATEYVLYMYDGGTTSASDIIGLSGFSTSKNLTVEGSAQGDSMNLNLDRTSTDANEDDIPDGELAGNLTLNMGAGNDSFYSAKLKNGDSVDMGAGDDYIAFMVGGGSGTPTIANLDLSKLDGGAGSDTMSWGESTGVNGQELTLTTGGATNFENIYGTSATETIKGDANDNILKGGRGGTDTIYGYAGNDTLYGHGQDSDNHNDSNYTDTKTLYGGTGNDTLYGGYGDDTLDGGTGTDTLTGGNGVDVFVIRAGDGSTTLANANVITDFSDGTDVISMDGVLYNDLTIEQGTGSYANHTLVSVSTTGEYLLVLQNITASNVTAADFSNANTEAQTFTGTSGNDTFIGGAGNDTFNGGAGNDILYGHGGNDTFNVTGKSASFTDTINGSSGTDTLDIDYSGVSDLGDFSTFTYDSSSGYFTLIDDNGGTVKFKNIENLIIGDYTYTEDTSADTFWSSDEYALYMYDGGNTSSSDITGLSGFSASANLTVQGSAQGDTMNLNIDRSSDLTGNLTLNMGAGDDSFNSAKLKNGDSVDMGAGDDAVWLMLTGSNGTPTIANANLTKFDGGAGTDTLYTEESGTNTTELILNDTFGATNFENLIGTGGAETIKGDANNNILGGGGGNDILYGYGGDDTLYGNGKRHSSDYGSDDQNVTGNNTLYGGAGNDTLVGGYHDDILDGGTGTDTLTGGNGVDTIVVRSGDGSTTLANSNVLSDFSNGSDIIAMDELSFSDLTIEQGTGDYASHTLVKITSSEEYLLILQNTTASDINIYDFSSTSTDPLILSGTSGDDGLVGGAGNDTFNGGAGSDTLLGFAGNDTFNISSKSGAYSETINGGSGSDSLSISYTGVSDLGDLSPISGSSSTGYYTLTDANGGTIKFQNIETLIVGDYTYTLNTSNKTYWNSTEKVVYMYALDSSGSSTSSSDITGLSGLSASDNLIVQGSAQGDTMNLNIDRSSDLTGNLTLNMGAGDDSFNSAKLKNGDSVDMGAGDDAVWLMLTGSNGTPTIANANLTKFDGGAGTDTLYTEESGTNTTELILNDTFGATNFENLIGTGGAETIKGDANNNILGGGGGNDILYGYGGDDTLYGNGKRHSSDYGSDDQNVTGNNTLYGGAGNDTLVGGYHDDILDGGTGTDTLTGGNGVDTFVIRTGDGSTTLANTDVITDFQDGTDLIGLDNNLAFSQLTIEQGTGSYASHTLVKVTATGEYLLIIQNTTASNITDLDFSEVNIADSSKPFGGNNNLDLDLDIDIDLDIDDDSIDDNIIDGTDLSDSNVWANEFDANSIFLPKTVISVVFDEANNLSDLDGFLGFESDSLALNFDAFSEDFLVADAQPVKTVDLSNSHAVMDHYQDSLLDDLVYSSELG